uniref:DRBM domain-containing protein n=1 Tax=Heterorhabditis bacteriophora TaxID=37862 RepID=A0A1I7XB76_HETBA
MPSIYDCFTPISELLIQEPSYFRQECSYVSNIKPQTNFSQKSPVTILLEGSRRIYDTLPIYTTISERHSEGNIPWFLISCSLMGVETQGEAKTKKSAKHIAAIAMLHAIVDKGYSKEFGLPSSSDEDAHKAMLVFTMTILNSNIPIVALMISVFLLEILLWISKEKKTMRIATMLIKIMLVNFRSCECQKNKMAMPIFESVESGPHHSKTFVTTCKGHVIPAHNAKVKEFRAQHGNTVVQNVNIDMDSMDLLAKLPTVAAMIYRNLYRDGSAVGVIDPKKDWFVYT